MKISRRSFLLGGAATVAAAGVSPLLSGCAAKTKSGLDFTKFETNGVGGLGLGLENVPTSNIPTKLYNIQNKNGAEVCITNLGARIVSLVVPDKYEELRDVVLGYDNIRDYANFNFNPKNFYGAICGRYANRIKDGKWTYNGETFQVDINENDNMLHGGKLGFHFQTFEVLDYDPSRFISLIFNSEDGDMGFPGRLTLKVIYTLNSNNTLGISYDVKTTRPCPINIMNHSFWCISGDPTTSHLDDNLTIYSKAFTPVDNELIPTGEIRPIKKGGIFDFFGESGEGKPVGRDKDKPDEQLTNGKGYDHNFVLMSKEELSANGISFDGKFEITDDGMSALDGKANLAAKLTSPKSGITMTITTSEPALQLYDCHALDAPLTGKHNREMSTYCGVALEPQHYPDSPNHPNFPNTILGFSEVYRSKSEFKFTRD